MRRFICASFALSLLLAFATLPARADDKSDIDATVQKSIAAFNTGNAKAIAALGAPGIQTVIDDFGVHYWASPNALANWFGDFGRMTKAAGAVNSPITVSPAKYVEIDKNHAWATYPIAFSYSIKGTAHSEAGVLAYALEKVAGTWRIQGIAWGRTS